MVDVSACLIVRNEAQLLPECLASLRAHVGEICVVDTGSTDSTVEIASAFGARVEHAAWTGDFSAARNRSLELAQRGWILVVDADERIVSSTAGALRTVVQSSLELAHLVVRRDQRPSGAPDRIALPRLFRNHPGIRYNRPVHEDVMDALFALGFQRPEACGLELDHVGYLPEVLLRNDKIARNLAILRQRHRDAPDDLYSAYKLAMTLTRGTAERATVIAHALGLAQRLSGAELRHLPFLPRLFELAAREHLQAGRLNVALDLSRQALGLFPDAVNLRQFMVELSLRVGHFERARTELHALKQDAALCEVRGDSAARFEQRQRALELALALDVPKPDAPQSDPLDTPGASSARLRSRLRQGHIQEVVRGLGPLLASHFDWDDVKLLGGELAWAQGDVDTALLVWGQTDPSSDAGHAAHGWMSLAQRVAKRPSDESTPGPCPVGRDVSSTALQLLIADIDGTPLALDEAFVPAAIASAAARWIRTIERAGRSDLACRARRFAA